MGIVSGPGLRVAGEKGSLGIDPSSGTVTIPEEQNESSYTIVVDFATSDFVVELPPSGSRSEFSITFITTDDSALEDNPDWTYSPADGDMLLNAADVNSAWSVDKSVSGAVVRFIPISFPGWLMYPEVFDVGAGYSFNSPLDETGGTVSMPAATSGQDGYATSTQITKLDGIESGAEVNEVASVFGRTGAITASDGDYAGSQVTFTDSGLTVVTGVNRVQAALGVVDAALAARYTKTQTDALIEAVKVLPSSRVNAGSTIATPLVRTQTNSASTIAISAGTAVIAPTKTMSQTISTLYIIVSATSLTGSQAVEIALYSEATDGGPGAKVWGQNITVGTSTGTLSAGSLSLSLPNSGCYIQVLNVSGNAGSVTLRSGIVTTSGRQFGTMGNANWSSVYTVTGLAAAPSDYSSYKYRTGTTTGVLNVDAATTFPIVGALV